MITPNDMRSFAMDCLRWSKEAGDASQRDIIFQLAKTWMATASVLERQSDVKGKAPSDLRNKLD
jgi:hypothetical protein